MEGADLELRSRSSSRARRPMNGSSMFAATSPRREILILGTTAGTKRPPSPGIEGRGRVTTGCRRGGSSLPRMSIVLLQSAQFLLANLSVTQARIFMAAIDAEHCRATGVWPTRPMTPFEPLPLPPQPRPRRSRARRALAIACGVIVALALLGAAGGVAYVLATGQT